MRIIELEVMMMRPKKTILAQRIHICVPPDLLDKIELYKDNHAISNRTSAILELVRRGLEEKK